MTDRKTQIMATATKLFLSEGLSISTANIAKAAGVSNGTLFNTFPTKQALIDAIYTEAKTAMFACIPYSGNAPLNRETMRANWDGYLGWASQHPEKRRIMHLLLEAGLVSAKVQDEVSALAAPHGVWLQHGLDKGVICAPSVTFVGALIFFHLDLVITEELNKGAESLAFNMLCNAIGLQQ